MKRTSAALLEFEELKALIGRYLMGPLGRMRLAQVQPLEDRAALEAILEETGEAIAYARIQPRLPLGMPADPTESVQKLRIEGASLEAKEIADLTAFLDRAAEARLSLLAERDKHPTLARRAEQIGEFRSLVREVSGKILPNGMVADEASVALHRLRREIERQRRHIQHSLEKFVRANRDEGVLQEEYVTVRNDRFVVPVMAGQRRKVEGVIHGASGTGQTLFIEPMETIELNNELVRLSEEELREVHRILREITSRFRAEAGAIQSALQVMGHLDLLFAKAAFALDFDCVIPKFSDDLSRGLHLRQARHPLLQDVLRRQQLRVVPVSVTLGDGTTTLLISGPNTGGKTVSMKTVGLLALMSHAGLPVPAAEAEFPIFDQVLADMGDQQSIEQSLSTFSAHITCIREMVEVATAESLVLLDELGRATDPEEGGALGVAILDHFRGIGAMTLASTHLLALKVYGANTASVLNASMGFDDQTLQPTYLLRTGAPGKSAGLDIATRLGLPQRLIDRARTAMSTTERDVARFLAELHDRVDRAAALEAELRQRLEAARTRESSLKSEWEKRESAKVRELERRFEELAVKFETDARATIDQAVQGIEQKKAAEQAMRKVARTKREFREGMDEIVLGDISKTDRAAPKIEEGSRVILKGVRQPARVRRILSGGLIEVDAGFLKMQVSTDDVQEVLREEREGAKLPKNVTFQSAGPKWDLNYREINVIGQRADEASDNVDRFLDQAALASVDRVRIVHGHGMGVLKRAVSDLLAKSPHVEKFYPASPAEGGSGATVAELKNA